MPAPKKPAAKAKTALAKPAKTKAAPAKPPAGLGPDERRKLWLTFPPKQITKPVVWELGHRFKLVTNVRQASLNDEVGIVCLEIDGQRSEIKAGIKWLEHLGIKVKPVEMNVIES